MVLRTMPAYRVIAYGLSDVGLVRANNEDAWACLSAFQLFALADGMGGHRAGEVASKAAIDFLSTSFGRYRQLLSSEPSPSQLCKMLYDVICEVNSQVYQLSCSDPALYGMGTTLCCLYLYQKYVIIAHVGDSRIYRYRQQKLIQMTKDHSLLLDMAGMWEDSSEDAFVAKSKYRNVITRAIGTEMSVDPSVYASDLHLGDKFLLCSDGLSDLIKREEMEVILAQESSVQKQAEELIELAKKNGGHDNITVVLIHVEKEPTQSFDETSHIS